VNWFWQTSPQTSTKLTWPDKRRNCFQVPSNDTDDDDEKEEADKDKGMAQEEDNNDSTLRLRSRSVLIPPAHAIFKVYCPPPPTCRDRMQIPNDNTEDKDEEENNNKGVAIE
jgi:hypothetical protein